MLEFNEQYPEIPNTNEKFRLLDCRVFDLYKRGENYHAMNGLMNELYKLIPGYEEHIRELSELLMSQNSLT